ncbi:MAG: hypothetical protein AAFZ63_02630 [Bacteroidota bacterium]
MKSLKDLTGGILVCIIKNGKPIFHYGENSFWLLDDWAVEIANGTYLDEIENLRVDTSQWTAQHSSKYLPELLINLDTKTLLNNYYDQALEQRVTSDWNGKWIENQDDFLVHIPTSARFWEVLPR